MPVSTRRDAPPVPRNRRLRMLCWNIQFAAGRGQHFFYDGGQAVSVDRRTVERHLDAIAEVIRREAPDLVLLQEVDRRSRRTARVDQHAELLVRVPYPCHVSTPYFRVPYVPYPPHEHLGRMDMHLSVFSTFGVSHALRHALAPIQGERWLRRQFNLRRALLELALPLADGGHMRVFDTHLSAFSHGDGTLALQIGAIDARLATTEREGIPWLLGADLNTLPPGDDPTRLGTDADLYADGSRVAPLIDHYRWPVRPDAPPAWTYQPFGGTPDRTIDYVLHGRAITAVDFRVLSDVADVSDHLPLVFDFVIPAAR